MTDKPVYSIIIPSLNVEKTISLCLESILTQDFSEFEVLVMDKFSTDSTRNIVESFQRVSNLIHFIQAEDSGVYDAMNRGIEIARGDWVFFLGADDVLYDEKVLSSVYQCLKNNRTKLCYGNVVFRYSKLVYGEKTSLYKLIFEKNICHQSVFYNRGVFRLVGNFNIDCKIYADREFNIRCFEYRRKLKPLYLNKVIAVYNELDGVSAKNDDPVFRSLQAMYVKSFKRRFLNRVSLRLTNIIYRISAFNNYL